MFPLLVDHFLQLNVQWGEEDARELLDFVERERKCKSLVDVVPNQLEEEFLLFAVALHPCGFQMLGCCHCC